MRALSLIEKEPDYSNVPVGSYYVRAFKSSWGLYVQTFKDGKKTDTKVSQLAFQELGFKFEWSLDQARERCKRLNKEKSLIKARVRQVGTCGNMLLRPAVNLALSLQSPSSNCWWAMRAKKQF